jgi:hypothetical protein
VDGSVRPLPLWLLAVDFCPDSEEWSFNEPRTCDGD